MPPTAPPNWPKSIGGLSLASDHVAWEGDVPAPLRARAILTLNDGAITVLAARPAELGTTVRSMRPVYRSGAGTLGVATGRVFVRFREGVDPRSREPDLARLGLRVAEVPPYAPHAAWLESTGSDPLAPLAALDAIRALPGVDHAEAELLRPVARK